MNNKFREALDQLINNNTREKSEEFKGKILKSQVIVYYEASACVDITVLLESKETIHFSYDYYKMGPEIVECGSCVLLALYYLTKDPIFLEHVKTLDNLAESGETFVQTFLSG